MSSLRERLERQAAAASDRANIQLALAQLCLREKDWPAARACAARAIELQPDYSAAYLCAGRAAQAEHDQAAARGFFESGLRVASAQGDKQIERQIGVFLKRLDADA